MSRVRVAVVGCGLVGQAEHAFYISTNRDLFDFAALVDASATVRSGVGDRYGVPVRVASVDELDASTLDAIIFGPFSKMISFPSRDQIGLLPPSDDTRTGAPGPGNGRTQMSRTPL